MKQYKIKDEAIEKWGDEWENIVTEDEVRRLSAEWDVPMEELLNDLEEA